MSLTSNPPPVFDERGTVWVVDDSPLETEMARSLLQNRHDVVIFSDGPAVIERIAQGIAPDLLILDWHMPVMSGLEICHFLRQTHDEADLPILILTATGSRDDLVDGLLAGANDFVTKEFNASELIARVSTLVRAKRLHHRVKQNEAADRKAREVAEQANRAKDIFLATVSHELRTPLNALLGWAQLLKGETNPDMIRRGLEVIERNAKIQVQLIEDILDVSRIVTGKFQLEKNSVHLSAVVQGAIDAVGPAANAKNITIEASLERTGRITGDADRLQQAVSNVIGNAIKFSENGSRVRVTLTRHGERFDIRVEDFGAGISEAFLPYVFDRFQQQDGSTTRRVSGLGLGLGIVRSVIEAHGGEVRAESAGEGKGAVFTLSIPDEEAPSSQAPRAEKPSAPFADRLTPVGAGLLGVDALIVEDDVDANELLVILLEQEGATSRQAFSVAEALRLFDEKRPSVIISDISLPGGDGYELLRAIRQREHGEGQTPAIALTAYARREDQRLAIDAGFQAHVAKPVRSGQLVELIMTLVRPTPAT